MGNIFYIADMHMGHSNIINLDKRPYSSVEEMDAALIRNWNSAVTDEDTVFVLGDFCWNTETRWIEILDQLNGTKTLIKGNHDRKSMSQQLRSRFKHITDYCEVKDNGKRVIMSHYPMPFYRGAYYENIVHLYGHVHMTLEYEFMEYLKWYIDEHDDRGNSKHKCQFYNVGCMLPYMHYTPRTLDEIIGGYAQYASD